MTSVFLDGDVSLRYADFAGTKLRVNSYYTVRQRADNGISGNLNGGFWLEFFEVEINIKWKYIFEQKRNMSPDLIIKCVTIAKSR